MKRAAIISAMVSLTVVISFLCLEGGYRLYKLYRYGMVDYPVMASRGAQQPDELYGMVPVKNFRSDAIPEKVRTSDNVKGFEKLFTINRWGYRGKDFSPQKAPDTLRIVAFGGSTTMDIESADPDTWPAQLEKRLDEDERFKLRMGVKHVEVINAGVGAWRTREGLLRLEKEVQHFSPDILLVAFNWNDPTEGSKGLDPDQPIRVQKPWWAHFALFQNMYVRYFVFRSQNEALFQKRIGELQRDRPWAKAYVRNLLEMQKISSGIGARMILVDLPGLCRKQGRNALEYELVVRDARVSEKNFAFFSELKTVISALLKDVGREHGLAVIDVSAYFESFSGAQRVALFEDVMHFSDAGAREVAEAIYQSLATDVAVGPGAPVPSMSVGAPGGR